MRARILKKESPESQEWNRRISFESLKSPESTEANKYFLGSEETKQVQF